MDHQLSRVAPGILRTVATAVVALLGLGIADLVAGYSVAGPTLDSKLEHLSVMASILGQAALFGFFLGIAGWIFMRITGLFSAAVRHRVDVTFWAFWAIAVVGFVHVNAETFAGTYIRSKLGSRYDLVVNGFRVAGAIGILIMLWVTRVALRRAATDRFVAFVMASFALFLGVTATWINVHKYPGIYLMIHTQIVAGAIGAFAIGAWIIVGRNKKLAQAVLAAALLLVGAALLARLGESYRRIVSSIVKRGAAVNEFATVTERALGVIVPAKSGQSLSVALDMSALDDSAAVAEAEKWFAENLPNRSQMNVLWIAVDTLRSDHVGYNGYERPTTPRIDELARESFNFAHAYSTYPTSSYSYSSILTSTFPRITPVYGQVMKKDWVFPDDLYFTVQMRKNGWQTSMTNGFTKAHNADPKWFALLATGVEVFNPDQMEDVTLASGVTDSTLRLLKAHGKRPFFHWVHYLDPHSPYDPPGDDAFVGESIDAYDSEIAYTDAQVGRLLDGLKASGDYENTIVVFFSDHGEEFREHGGREHNTSVYDEQVRVPLLIRIPGMQGRTITSPVSLADVTPTMFGVLGIKDDQKRLGKSLLPYLVDPTRDQRPPAPIYSEYFFLLASRHNVDKRTVILGKKKIIKTMPRESWEIYDLEKDPGEKSNLVGRDDKLEAELRSWLTHFENRIDAYHREGGPTTQRVDPNEAFKREVSELVGPLGSKDTAKITESVNALNKTIFDYLGEQSADATYRLGAEELDKIARRVATFLTESESKADRLRLTRFLADLKLPVAADALREQLKQTDQSAVIAAIGLARMGFDDGRELLRQSLTLPVPVDKREIATALALLDDPAARPWIPFGLQAERWRYVGQMVLAMKNVKDPHVGWLLRDWVPEGYWSPKPVQMSLAKALATHGDDIDARWMLMLLANDSDPTIRELAAESLDAVGVKSEEIDRARDAAISELEAVVSIKNRNYELGAKQLRQALENGPTYNAAARLRLARYLHHDGKPDEARKVLEDVRDKAPNQLDRDLAKRRVEMLGAPARILDQGLFGAKIKNAAFPEWWMPNQPVLVTLEIENTGKVPWQGGVWQHGSSLVVRWSGEEGELLDQNFASRNWLPPHGVMPGETLPMTILALPPDGRDLSGRPIITFEQPWLSLPEKNVIYRHDKMCRISTDQNRKDDAKPQQSTSRKTTQNQAPPAGPGKIEVLSKSALAADRRFGVKQPDVPVYKLDDSGKPITSNAGFVQLADEGPGFYYGCLVGEFKDYARDAGLLNTNNWGDIESMALASRVVWTWLERHPDGPRLGIDEISSSLGGYPDYDKDGVSDHKTHQTGMNVNFLLPCKTRPEKYIHVGRRNDELYDPVLFRELIDILVDNGAFRMTTNNGLRVTDDAADLPKSKYAWRKLEGTVDGFSTTWATGTSPVRLYLLAGKGEHGDHVNTLLWKGE